MRWIAIERSRENQLTELDEKTNNAADDQQNLSGRVEHFAAIYLVEILVVTLNQ